jgi:hypothetical protein
MISVSVVLFQRQVSAGLIGVFGAVFADEILEILELFFSCASMAFLRNKFRVFLMGKGLKLAPYRTGTPYLTACHLHLGFAIVPS